MKHIRPDAARRWLVVGAGILCLGLLPAAIGAIPASGAADIAPDALAAKIAASAAVPHEGYAVAVGTLGLPDVSPLQDVEALLSSTTRLRVWWQGDTQWRIDKLDLVSETDTYRSGDRSVVWSSADQSAVVRPAAPVLRLPEPADLEPGQLARRLVSIGAADTLEKLSPRRVGGESAPGVRIRPTDPDATIDHVDIWADAATGLPLRVELTGRGDSRPSLSSSYQEIDIGHSEEMTFELAPDAQLETADAGDVATRIDQFAPYALPDTLTDRPRRDIPSAGLITGGIGVYGTGLTSLVVVPLPSDIGRRAFDGFAAGQQVALERTGFDARSLSTSLLNAELVSAGRRWYLIAGTVTVEELTRAAQQLIDAPPARNDQ